jgi:hypothetical protein
MLLELLAQMDTVQTIVQDGLLVLEILYIAINQDGPTAVRQVRNLMGLLVLLVISKNYWGGFEVGNRSVSSGGSAIMVAEVEELLVVALAAVEMTRAKEATVILYKCIQQHASSSSTTTK